MERKRKNQESEDLFCMPDQEGINQVIGTEGPRGTTRKMTLKENEANNKHQDLVSNFGKTHYDLQSDRV